MWYVICTLPDMTLVVERVEPYNIRYIGITGSYDYSYFI